MQVRKVALLADVAEKIRHFRHFRHFRHTIFQGNHIRVDTIT